MTSIMRNKKRRKNQASGDSSPECSNTDIEVVKTKEEVDIIEVAKTIEVVKIDQKDVMDNMVTENKVTMKDMNVT